MVERRRLLLLVSVLLITVVAALGYSLGRTATLGEQMTTTTTLTITTTTAITSATTMTATTTVVTASTVTATQTATSSTSITITETKIRNNTSTLTTTIIRQPPGKLPPPANSSAIILSRMLFNGDILVLLSIDKPAYRLGETVHIKGTVTNLSPRSVVLDLPTDYVLVVNSTGKAVWTFPERPLAAGFGEPMPHGGFLTLASGETKLLGTGSSADWNMTGIRPPPWPPGTSRYYDHFVPTGQYNIIWSVHVYNDNFDKVEGLEATAVPSITFTITN